MTPPLRILAYLDDEEKPGWWYTIDGGRTYRNAQDPTLRVTAERLSKEASGFNDQQLIFPRQRRAAFQKPRHG
jgi:hypothetical protein